MKTASIQGAGGMRLAGGEGKPSREKIGAPWAKFFLALLAFAVLYSGYRIYSEASAFTYGLDYFSQEFDAYWMRLLYGQLLLIVALGTVALVYLWRTRERDFSRIGPREEVRRLFVLMALGVLYLLIIFPSLTLWLPRLLS